MSDLTPNPLAPSLPNPGVAAAAERQAEAILASRPGAAGGDAKPPNTGPAPGPDAAVGTTAAPNAAKPEPPKAERDPILDLVDKMNRAAAVIGGRDAGLVAGIQRIAAQAAEPGRSNQALFRTQVAYTVQDLEKLVGSGQIRMPAELRTEMTGLAATSPGLENGRMQALIGGTPDIADRGLVRDLRRAGTILGTMGADQHSQATMEVVEALENRVRLSARAEPPSVDARAQPNGAAHHAPSQTVQNAPPSGDPAVRAADAPRGGQAPSAADPAAQTRVTASPGDPTANVTTQEVKRDRADHEVSAASDQPQQTTDQRGGVQPKSVMANIMDGMRTAQSTAAAPWAPPPIAMAERIASFERALGQGKTDQLIRSTEASGVAYMEAIETFSKGPGAAILRKIEDAASTEPGGMRAVMSEMQVGGRYASLRGEFDAALQQDRVFAASYEQLERSGQQFGKERLALASDFEAKKLDARTLDARFQQADEAIGEATAKIPGRTPGRSAMEELGQKVAEILSKATQRLKAMFGRDADPAARPSSGPSPSP